MLKVAILGCGKIADSHVSEIQRIEDCQIVGVCDREPLMARQLCERFSIKRHFTDVSELLSELRPDVVHITTPPDSHFGLAKLCLERGAHVYVEKPFTLCEHDARRLFAIADEKQLKVTAGHDDQFTHGARRMRALVESGFIGGGPLHMESYYCYELSGDVYATALLGDKRHWIRRLPGRLLQNIISHGISRIAEYLTSESPRIIAYGFISPFLMNRGEREIIDELRVIIAEEDRTTAYFTFSSQMRPALRQFRLYGPRNGLVYSRDWETVVKLRGAKFKSYAETFIPPLNLAGQYLTNLSTNLRAFLARDFHMKSGMQYLIKSFYRSITDNAPVPIPYRQILLTANIMDAIFLQLDEQRSQAEMPPDNHAVLVN